MFTTITRQTIMARFAGFAFKRSCQLMIALIILQSGASVSSLHKTAQQPETAIQVKTLDPRAQILQDYFVKYNSPLASHAQDFIDAADSYGVDWKLLPAITGVESTFGKFIPGGQSPQTTSYNGWGWGVYGNHVIYFKSWREGIFIVTAGLKQNYISKGMSNPYTINRAYSASSTWGSRVAYFMNDLTTFEKNHPLRKKAEAVRLLTLNAEVAGNSAILSQNQ